MGKEMAELNILLLATQTVLSSGIFFFTCMASMAAPMVIFTPTVLNLLDI